MAAKHLAQGLAHLNDSVRRDVINKTLISTRRKRVCSFCHVETGSEDTKVHPGDIGACDRLGIFFDDLCSAKSTIFVFVPGQKG